MIAQIDKDYVRMRPMRMYQRLISYLFFEGRPLTTRGRWINNYLFAMFAVLKKLPLARAVKQPVFILGTGRSGTTILGVVLSMHKRVGFLNEPKALWHSLYPSEDIVGNYTTEPARYRLSEDDATCDVIKNAHRLYSWYLAVSFSNVVVDKYPELIFRIPFIKRIFPDAKFVFLIRDGMDTCKSIESWSDRLGTEEYGAIQDWWGNDRRKWLLLVDQIVPEHPDLSMHRQEILGFTKQTDMAAVEWIVTMREGLKWMERDPLNVVGVRFEDMSSEPENVLKMLSSFIGLEDDAVFQEYGVKTLRPVRKVERFELNPILQKPFSDTMRRLGYS